LRRKIFLKTKLFFTHHASSLISDYRKNQQLIEYTGHLLNIARCRADGYELYRYEKSFGLRAKVLVDSQGFITYCVDEPSYTISDIERAVARIFSRITGEKSLDANAQLYLSPDSLDDYLEAKIATGLGRLYPLVLDPEIEEVALNRPGDPLFVYHRKLGVWMRTNIVVDEPEASRIALSISNLISRPLSMASPMAEGSSKLGLRFAVTLGDRVSPRGTSFVVRKSPLKPLSMPELIKQGFISPLQASYLWFLLEHRGFLVIIGGMATGKTTLLQALLDLLPWYTRIVVIEDTPEVKLTHPNWDSLSINRGFSIGSSVVEASMFDLARFALRRRSDFLVIGEVRGEEAKVLFQASISGQGSLCLDPDERLVVMDKRRRVRRMRISTVIEKLVSGEEVRVLSLSGEGELGWAAPRRWIVTVSHEWVELSLSTNTQLRLTPDHLVPVVTDKGVMLRKALMVGVGERILFIANSDVLSEDDEPVVKNAVVVAKRVFKRSSAALDLELSGDSHLFVHSSGAVTHNCSFHADDVETAVARLTSPPISIPASSLRYIWGFIVLGFRGGARRVVGISETDPYSEDLVFNTMVFTDQQGTEPRELVERSARLKKLASAHGYGREELLDEIASRAELLQSLSRKGADSTETRRTVDSFYALKLREMRA
jgi:type IV secretory pathway ATPase VirB11/archaellum biosynthesis ATPase